MTRNDGDLEGFFDSYRQAYTDLDLDAVVEHYNVPLLSVTPGDLYWLTDAGEVRSVMGAYLDRLRERDYDRGEIDGIACHRLSDADALASSAWTRYTTAGDVLERLGTTYLLREGEGGWRIVALAIHDYDAAIA